MCTVCDQEHMHVLPPLSDLIEGPCMHAGRALPSLAPHWPLLFRGMHTESLQPG